MLHLEDFESPFKVDEICMAQHICLLLLRHRLVSEHGEFLFNKRLDHKVERLGRDVVDSLALGPTPDLLSVLGQTVSPRISGLRLVTDGVVNRSGSRED